MINIDKPSQVRFIRRKVFAKTTSTRFLFFFCLIGGMIPMSMNWYFGFNATRYQEMTKALGKTQNLYFLIASVFLLGALIAGLYLAYQMYKEYKILQFIFDNSKEKFYKVEKIHLENISAKYKQRIFEIRSELGELVVLKISDYDSELFDLQYYLSNQQGEFLAYHTEKYPQRFFTIGYIKKYLEGK